MQGPVFQSLLNRLDDRVAPLAPGCRIGPFRIVELLGRGGMACVYIAERADGAYEQNVALKLLHPHLCEPSNQDILRRERQILAFLKHPGIAWLLDGGSTEDGRLWLAMQLIDGVRIDRHCDTVQAGVRERLRLFRSVCDAVHYAHVRGVVHKDIKPGNILVTAEGETKLLDFGIATGSGSEGLASAPAALTPGFASPEQVRGDVVTTASDTWQLGLLLDRLTRPLRGRRARDLDAIVARAMQEDPAARYASVAELGADIDNFLARRPVAARGDGWPHRVLRFVQRNLVASAIALLAVAALLGVVAHFTLQLARERDKALAEAGRAKAAQKFMAEVFRVSDPGEHRGDRLTANQILENGQQRLQNEYRDQPRLRAELLESIGLVYSGLGELERAETLLMESIDIARADPAAEPAVLARQLSQGATIKLRRGSNAEAEALLGEAIAVVERGAPEEKPNYLMRYGSIQRRLGHIDKAVATLEEATRTLVETSDAVRRDKAYAHAFLCEIVAGEMQDPQRAEPHCASALALFARITDPRALQETAQIEVLHALQLARIGRIERARETWRAAYARELHAFGEDHRRVRWARSVAAEIEEAGGDLQAALSWSDQAVAAPFLEQWGDGVREEIQVVRGRLLLSLYRTQEAAAVFRAAREGVLARAPPDPWLLSVLDYQLGRTLCRMGGFDEGRTRLRAALVYQTQYAELGRAAEATRAALDDCVTRD
jgi:eukaryotic-like serine/threonine-protein kinase